MKYEEMTMDQIDEITRRGGDQLRKLNKAVADYLDGLKLSDKAREQISQTDFNNMADVFGGFVVAFLFIYKYMSDRHIKAIYTIYRVYTPIDY